MPFLTEDALDLPRLVAQVAAPERGGIATFLGLVRNHNRGREVLRLDYSAYGAMAEEECGRIVAEAESRWPVRVAIAHRLGRVEIGEASVGVAAAAAHRSDAFEACRYVTEELKRRVPIWKREFFADGTEAWVDPTAAARTASVEARRQ